MCKSGAVSNPNNPDSQRDGIYQRAALDSCPAFSFCLPSKSRGVFALQISTLPLTLPLPFNFNLYLTFLQDNSRIREDNLLIYASFSDILIKGKCFPLLYLKVMLMDISYKKIMEATHVRGDTLSFSN